MNHFKINNKHYQVIASLIVIMVLATACNAGVEPLPTLTTSASTPIPSEIVAKPSPTQTGISPLTEEMLKNTTYQGVYQDPTQLTGGIYTGIPNAEGAASQPTINFISPYATGDLSGDGVEDAAVILVANSGGTGSFVYLAAMLNQQGQPANVATLLLGDRIQVQSLTIAEGQIIVKLKRQGPNDPMCCPTQEVENAYALQGNELVLTTSKILG